MTEENLDGEPAEDSENYRSYGKKTATIEDLGLTQMSRINKLMTRELRGGFWDERVALVNGVPTKVRTYIEDSRAAVCNGVEALYFYCAYVVTKNTGDLAFMKDVTAVKKQIDDLKDKFINDIEGKTEEYQKARRYQYVSEKLTLSKKMYHEILQIMAKINQGEQDESMYIE